MLMIQGVYFGRGFISYKAEGSGELLHRLGTISQHFSAVVGPGLRGFLEPPEGRMIEEGRSADLSQVVYSSSELSFVSQRNGDYRDRYVAKSVRWQFVKRDDGIFEGTYESDDPTKGVAWCIVREVSGKLFQVPAEDKN